MSFSGLPSLVTALELPLVSALESLLLPGLVTALELPRVSALESLPSPVSALESLPSLSLVVDVHGVLDVLPCVGGVLFLVSFIVSLIVLLALGGVGLGGDVLGVLLPCLGSLPPWSSCHSPSRSSSSRCWE